jgi:hypothetical protein
MSRFSTASRETAGQVGVLTRQGISLIALLERHMTSSGGDPCASLSLHVAMQMGPSHDPVSWISGVWPLRIPTGVVGSSRLHIPHVPPPFGRWYVVERHPSRACEAKIQLTLDRPFLLVFCTRHIVTVPLT